MFEDLLKIVFNKFCIVHVFVEYLITLFKISHKKIKKFSNLKIVSGELNVEIIYLI